MKCDPLNFAIESAVTAKLFRKARNDAYEGVLVLYDRNWSQLRFDLRVSRAIDPIWRLVLQSDLVLSQGF